MSSTEDRFAVLDGLRICYRQDGALEAPAVFLVAGLGMQLIEWPDALVEALARRFHVIRLDNRDSGLSSRCGGPFEAVPPGFSWSGSTPELAAYDLRDMAQDVIDLADHLGIDRFACVGFSMGGMIAQLLAVLSPDRLRALASLSSTGGAAQLSADAPSTRLMERFFLPFASKAEEIAAILDSNAHFSRGALGRSSAANLAIARALSARGHDEGGYLRQTLAITTTQTWMAELESRNLPALFVHGTDDPCITASRAYALAMRMGKASFISCRDLGHWVDDTVSHRVADWLVDALQTA